MGDPPTEWKGLEVLTEGEGGTTLRDLIRGLSGTKLMERILELSDPRQVLQGLPPTDFYWVVKKVGEQDSLPLLELASEDQWEHLLDLEIWRRDRIALRETGSWLKRLHTADGVRLARWLMGEGELLGRLYLSRLLDVKVKEQETDTVPDGFFTLDDVYYLRVRDPGQEGWIQELMADMAKLDYDGAPYVVINARTNLIYPWDHSHDEGGRAWFSVRTRWTLRNPSWKADPWVLRYRCGHIFAAP